MAFHQEHKNSRDNIGRLCAALREPFKPLTQSQVIHHKSGLDQSVFIYNTVGLNYRTLCYTVLMSFQKKPFIKKKFLQAEHSLASES